jgi:hypothetical protein
MAPSAIDVPMTNSTAQDEVRPQQLYSIREAHFESFIQPQPRGYEEAIKRGSGNAAIVIDNGKFRNRRESVKSNVARHMANDVAHRFVYYTSRMVL